MTCRARANLSVNRNADFPFSIQPKPASKIDLTGCQVEMQIRAEAGAEGDPLISIGTVANPAGSILTVAPSVIGGIIKQAELEALPDPQPGEPWVGVHDVILIDTLGIRHWFIGGDFIVLEGVTR